MQIAIRGKNVEISPPLREYLSKRLAKLERYFDDVMVSVSLSAEPVGYSAEITVPLGGLLVRAEEKAEDLYSAIDLVVEKLVRQVDRFRKRLQDRRQATRVRQPAVDARSAARAAPEPGEGVSVETPEANGRVVRVKRFALKPMAVEEAILQMNLLGHDFFVFTDAVSERFSVVYRRHDGNYGLIEAEP